MARKFYTPISLTGLELQNFKIQNLPDNPSPYGAGHSYYNTAAKELRIYDGTNWVPVGGSVEYGLYADIPAAGNNGRVYATTDTQTLYLDYSGSWVQIGASGSATYVNSISGTTNQVNVSQSSGDVTLSLPLDVKIDQSLQIGGWNDADNGFITVKNYLGTNVLEVNSNLSPNDQYHGYNTYTNATGVININSFVNLSSEGNEPAGFLFVNPTGGGSTYPTVHLEATGDLALRAGASDSHANDGNIILYTGSTSGSGTGKVYIGWNNNGGAGANASNQVATIGDINNSLFITSVDSNNFTVDAGQLLLNTTIYTNTVSSTNTGADNFFLRGGYSNINLNSDTGNIELNPDGVVNANSDLFVGSGHNLTVGNNAFVKYGLYTGGATTATDGYITLQDASGADLVTLSGTSGTGHIQTHGDLTLYAGYNDGGTEYGHLSYDGDKNFIINGNFNDVILTSDSGYAYIGNNSTSATRIATLSDIQNAQAGLNVKLSVLLAESTTNVDLGTFNVDGGYLDGNGAVQAGSRVLLLAQTTATENGIYIVQNDGSLTRAADSLNPEKGDFTLVETGTHASQGWILTDPTTGTWVQFSAAGEYTAGNGINISGGAISAVVNDAAGMSLNGDGIAANLGTGLQFNGSSGAIEIIDYTYLTKKMAQTIGDASNISFDIIHNFGTLDVSVTIYDTNTGEEVFADVTHSNTSKINVAFAVAPTVNQFRVVVVG